MSRLGSFEILEQEIPPPPIAARATGRRLCIWSAGCCTARSRTRWHLA